jgi:hypothetical protein
LPRRKRYNGRTDGCLDLLRPWPESLILDGARRQSPSRRPINLDPPSSMLPQV